MQDENLPVTLDDIRKRTQELGIRQTARLTGLPRNTVRSLAREPKNPHRHSIFIAARAFRVLDDVGGDYAAAIVRLEDARKLAARREHESAYLAASMEARA